jgi:hypothetical protein
MVFLQTPFFDEWHGSVLDHLLSLVRVKEFPLNWLLRKEEVAGFRGVRAVEASGPSSLVLATRP